MVPLASRCVLVIIFGSVFGIRRVTSIFLPHDSTLEVSVLTFASVHWIECGLLDPLNDRLFQASILIQAIEAICPKAFD